MKQKENGLSKVQKRKLRTYSLLERTYLKTRHLMRSIPDYMGFTRRNLYQRRKDDRNALFIWIPKTAGTSLVEWSTCEPYLNLHRVRHCFPGCGTTTFGHMNYATLAEQSIVDPAFFRSCYIFSIVRNPYTRAVSLYRYLQKMQDIPESKSFESFCKQLIREGCEPIGLYNYLGLSQCNPQVRWLEGIQLDKLIHIEELSAALPLLWKELQPGKPMPPFPVLNRSKPTSLEKEYTLQSKAAVEELYAEDFEKLGYPLVETLEGLNSL